MNILLHKHVSIKSKQKENKKKIKGMKNSEEKKNSFLFFGISFCNQNLNKQAKHIELTDERRRTPSIKGT